MDKSASMRQFPQSGLSTVVNRSIRALTDTGEWSSTRTHPPTSPGNPDISTPKFPTPFYNSWLRMNTKAGDVRTCRTRQPWKKGGEGWLPPCDGGNVATTVRTAIRSVAEALKESPARTANEGDDESRWNEAPKKAAKKSAAKKSPATSVFQRRVRRSCQRSSQESHPTAPKKCCAVRQ